MFRLDALILLRANEAKLWGTSIYSYVEACQHVLLLNGMHTGCSVVHTCHQTSRYYNNIMTGSFEDTRGVTVVMCHSPLLLLALSFTLHHTLCTLHFALQHHPCLMNVQLVRSARRSLQCPTFWASFNSASVTTAGMYICVYQIIMFEWWVWSPLP